MELRARRARIVEGPIQLDYGFQTTAGCTRWCRFCATRAASIVSGAAVRPARDGEPTPRRLALPPFVRVVARLRRHPVALIVIVALFAYAAIAFLVMTPVLAHCTTTVLGPQPSNGTAAVWTNWEFTRLGGPFAASTPDVAAPQGRAFFLFDFMRSLVELLPQWVATNIFGPVCSYNLLIYIGFVLDGMAVFGMVWWLTRRPFVAFIAGYASSFIPFHIEAAYTHIDYVHSWPLALVMWAMLGLIQRPSWRRALLAGASTALAGYADGYSCSCAPTIAITLAIAGAGWWLRRSGWHRPALRFPAMTGLAVAAAAALMAPLAVIFLLSRSTLTVLLTRAKADLYASAARPLDPVLPSSPPVLRLPGRGLRGSVPTRLELHRVEPLPRRLGRADRRSRGRACHLFRSARARLARGLALPPQALVTSMILLVVVAGILSCGGLPRSLTTPADLIYAVFPFLRAYSRLVLVVDLAVVVLASLALCRHVAVDEARRRWHWAEPWLSLPLTCSRSPPWRVWSYPDSVPAVYQWVARRPPSTIIAEYPSDQVDSQPISTTSHSRSCTNGACSTGRWPARRVTASSSAWPISASATLPVLRALGVDFVLIHNDLYTPPGGASPVVPGLHQVTSVDGVTVYQIDPGPLAKYAITLNQGFDTNGLGEPTSETWLDGSGEMGIWSLRRTPPPLDISFEMCRSPERRA